MPKPDQSPVLLKAIELAARWRISVTQVHRIIAAEKLPHYRLGGKAAIRIPLAAVEQFERDQVGRTLDEFRAIAS